MTELTALKGIGEKTAGALNRLGIYRAEDLVRYYPRDYETFSDPVPLHRLTPGGTFTVESVLQKDAALNRFNGMTIVNVYLADMTGRLQLSWFNAPFLKNSLKAGRHLVFRGRVYEKNGRLIMSQPRIYDPVTYREKYAGRMMPLYSLTKGISNQTLVKAVTEALKRVGGGPEYLPAEVREPNDLPDLSETVIRMHFPRSREELLNARRRVVFEEFFMAMLAGAYLSEHAGRQASTHVCRPNVQMIRFMADLPFSLTKAQSKAYREIAADMASGRVMNRLVEGDVGSGKTIVAVLAMLNAALNGYQSAFMAPTAVLAKQHYETITGLLKSWDGGEDSALINLGGFGMPAAGKGENTGDPGAQQPALQKRPLRVVLVTGSMSAAERKAAHALIRDHEADIIIGTHTLFQEKLEYADLGLIVTDEQHRFGVGQREALYRKGEVPHTLVMSATPIPRTLAIILYSDMDISVIDARPEGRIPIKNAVVGPGYRPNAYRFIAGEIKKGRQAYVICPAIEAGEDEDGAGSQDTAVPGELENVADYAGKLKKLMPPDVRIGVLHGRMKGDEKESVMEAFKNREIDLLVSTTVVEVGVDVPNATVMMIENAERFGLAELHQLRGRVGRGEWQSYCIMVNTSDTDKAAERLDILNHSNDGFRIAEEDLRLRGPGDIFGVRQSGERSFRVADIYQDADVLKMAKDSVTGLLKADRDLSAPAHEPLRKLLEQYLEKGQMI
ncbi:MAG: ATP-dependent DNA helicase RecG [Lachnospiraceae bacterium]|nr:ATP-dependent DNA helicase RecG [Lachnospiraceae bacterium]